MCFGLGLIENLIIWAIVVIAVVAIIKLLLPLITGPFAWLSQLLTIILYAIIAIAVVIVVFDLLSCLLGGARLLR